MKTRELDMIVDRELRNGALALVKADIANVKQDLSTKGIKDRVTHRMTDGAVDLFEDATEMADNNRGALAALLAAVGIWFARNPILSLLGLEHTALGELLSGNDASDADYETDRAGQRGHMPFGPDDYTG